MLKLNAVEKALMNNPVRAGVQCRYGAGEFTFTYGMNMMRGKLIVQDR